MCGDRLALPDLLCGVCVGLRERDDAADEPAVAVTVAAGWFVCAAHAGLLVLDLIEQRFQIGTGDDLTRSDGSRRRPSDVL